MEIYQLITPLYQNLLIYTLIYVRIIVFLSTFSVLRHGLITTKILLSLTLVLSAYALLLNKFPVVSFDLMSLQMIVNLLYQVFLGFMAALILNITFEVFTAAGQFISTQIGLSMVSLFEPGLGQITVLTRFFNFTAVILFFFLNGHLYIIQAIVESFSSIPLFQDSFSIIGMETVAKYAGTIFSGSVILSLSVIITILITNITLAIMSKFAPQINVLTIGINISLILGLLCVYATFSIFIDNGNEVISNGLNVLISLFVRN